MLADLVRRPAVCLTSADRRAVLLAARRRRRCRRRQRHSRHIDSGEELGAAVHAGLSSIGETASGFVRPVVAAWYAEGFRDFVFYDPPYGRPGVPVAAPSVVDDVLAASLPSLRSGLSTAS